MDTDRWLCTWALLCLVLVAMTTGEPDPLRRRYGDDIRRRRINIVTIQSDPYIRLNWSPGLIGNERYEGYYIDLVSKLADLAGFDYSLHLVGDGKLGHHGEDGWTGMVGELLQGSADLTLGPLSVTRERQTVVDFTTTIAEVKLAIVMAKNKDKPSSSDRITSGTTFTNLPALLARSDLKFAALRNSDAVQALMTSLDSNARALYRRLQEQSMTSLMGNMYEALEFVRREGYALVLDFPIAEYYIGREPCDLEVVASFLEGRHYALATKKGVPLLGEMNRAIEMLKGQRSHWDALRRKWWRPQCPGVSLDGATGGGETNGGKSNEADIALSDISTSSSPPIRHVKVTTELNPPFVIQSPDGSLSGYTIQLLENIAHLVPFRYDVTFSRDGAGFGKRKRNRWNGMAGELVREEADLAAAAFTSNRGRDRVLSYTKPFLHSTLSILIRTSTTNDEVPIFFMEDLLNQTEYTYGVVRGSHLEKDLKLSEEHVPSEIWKNIIKDKRRNVVRTMEDGLRKVRNEKFALIIPSTYATYLSSKVPCDLMAMDQFMFITNYMFALKKGNPLVDKIDEALISLQEDGVLQMLFHKWWNTGDCLGATEPAKTFSIKQNGTIENKDEESSSDWMHGLFTFSARWQKPTTTTPLTITTTTTTKTTTPTTTTEPQKAATSTETNPPTTAVSSRLPVNPVPYPDNSDTEMADNDDMVIHREMTSVTATAQPISNTVPSTSVGRRGQEDSNQKHKHRHGHRERGRGGRRRGRGRNKERRRNRNNLSSNTTDATTTSTTGKTNTEENFHRVTNTPALTMSTSTLQPASTAGPPPKPPVWDGKYIYGDGLLSTRTPENFSIDLELIPAEEDSIRIFPFTYKPHQDKDDDEYDQYSEGEDSEEDFQEESGPIATAAPPDINGNNINPNRSPATPSIESHNPTGKGISYDRTDNILRITTTIQSPTHHQGSLETPKDENILSSSGYSIMSCACCTLISLLSILGVCLQLCTINIWDIYSSIL